MICKNCGTFNEDYLEYCKNCASLLEGDAENTGILTAAESVAEEVSEAAEVIAKEADKAANAFVTMPDWKNFDTNVADDEEMPPQYIPKYQPRKAAAPKANAPKANTPKANTPVKNEVVPILFEEDEDFDVKPFGKKSPFTVERAEEAAQEPDALDGLFDDFDEPETKKPKRRSGGLFAAFTRADDDEDDFDDEIEDEGEEFDDEEEYYEEPVRKPRRSRQEKPAGIRYADPVDDDYFHEANGEFERDDFSGYNKRRGGGVKLSGKVKLIGIIVAALLVVLGITAIILGSAYDGLGNFTSHAFGGNPFMRPTTLETSTMEDGSPAYKITVYAPNGSSVRFTHGSLNQQEQIKVDNRIIFRIPEAFWMPSEPAETNPHLVTPNLTLITKDGEEVPITEFIVHELDLIVGALGQTNPEGNAYTEKDAEKGVAVTAIPIEVPSIVMTLTSPVEMNLAVSSPSLLVEGKVESNLVEVTVNGVAVVVDDTGAFSHTVTLENVGAQTVLVEAKRAGYMTARQEIKVDYSLESVNFSLDEGVALRTKSSTLTLKGKVSPGSTISVTGVELAGEPTVLSDGSFTIEISMPEVGFADATILVSNGGLTTQETLHVERAPADSSAFKENAQRLDYDRCVETPFHKQDYYQKECTVVEIINAEPYVIAKIKFTSGRVAYIIYHNSYDGAAEIEEGKTYSIGCIPNGLYEETGCPYLYTWFVWRES